MLAVDHAGGDRVDIDAVLDEVEPRRLGERDDRGLGGAIDGHEGFAPPAGLACHVDDLAALAAGDHRFCDRLQHEEGACDIDRKQPIIALAGDLDDRRQVEQGGIVDQYVDPAGRLLDGFYRRIDRGLVGDVEPDGIGRRADLGGGCAGAFQIDVVGGNPGTLAHIGLGKGLADPARSARDDGRLAFKTSGHCASPRSLKRCRRAGSGVM